MMPTDIAQHSDSLMARLRTHPPGRVALEDAEAVTLTYADLLCEVRSVRHWLSSMRAQAIAIDMDNSPAWVVVDLALSTLPLAVVPIPPFFNVSQRVNAFSKSGCRYCIVDRVQPGQCVVTQRRIAGRLLSVIAVTGDTDSCDAELAALATDVAGSHSLKITFTSGSTGMPKGVRLSTRHLTDTAMSIASVLSDEPIERHLSVLPLGVLLENVAGVQAALWRGITCVIPSVARTLPLSVQHPEHCPLIQTLNEQQPQSCILMPALLQGCMEQVGLTEETLNALTYVAVGGAAVSPALLEEASTSGMPVYEGYGLSEAGSVVTMNTPSHHRPGTVGRVLPHHQLSTDRVGELILTNPGFCGYTGQPFHSDKDRSVFRTGDLGAIDADGYVSISGRLKNVLITAMGRNISPEWIESRLISPAAISQALVYGDGDDTLSALIVPSGDASAVSGAIESINVTLPEYARVHQWRVVPAFSVSNGQLATNGKIIRDRITRQYGIH